jgi:hypothetical protein
MASLKMVLFSLKTFLTTSRRTKRRTFSKIKSFFKRYSID